MENDVLNAKKIIKNAFSADHDDRPCRKATNLNQAQASSEQRACEHRSGESGDEVKT